MISNKRRIILKSYNCTKKIEILYLRLTIDYRRRSVSEKLSDEQENNAVNGDLEEYSLDDIVLYSPIALLGVERLFSTYKT